MKTHAKLNIDKYKNLDQYSINKKFIGACVRGDIELMKFIINTPEIPKPLFIDLKHEAFAAADSKSDLHTYLYLLEIYKDQEIPKNNYRAIFSKGDVEKIQYHLPMMTKPELVEAIGGLVRVDNLELLKKLQTIQSLPFEMTHIITGWGYAPKVLSWLLNEGLIEINQDLKDWTQKQPDKVMHSMLEIKHFIASFLIKEKLEKSLDSKNNYKQRKI